MSSTPTNPNPPEIPPYQLQPLIETVLSKHEGVAPEQVTCLQALGSEIYVGCSSGRLLRFVLTANDPTVAESYNLISQQNVPTDKAITEMVVVPSIARVLVQSGGQIYFYTVPSLDLVVAIKPIRHAITFAVDNEHLKRPFSAERGTRVEPVEFSVIKTRSVALFNLRNDRLIYQKELPLPQPAITVRRSGRFLCAADKEYYNVIDLEAGSLLPIFPLTQDPEHPVKPLIAVVTPGEFMVLSWTGANAFGVFVTGEGNPMRGTLEWMQYPLNIAVDFPYVTTLLPNGTIEIHSIETQSIVQVLPAPTDSTSRVSVASSSLDGHLVPSKERSEKMRMVEFALLRDPLREIGKRATDDGTVDPPLAEPEELAV